MPWLSPCRIPVTSQVSLCELGVEQGHLRCRMAEQFHEGGKTDTGAEHFRRVGMTEHVGRDESINAQQSANVDEFAAKFSQPAIWRHRAERAEETEPVDELANGLIDGNQTLGVQLAKGHVKSPLSRRDLAQAIEGEIGALAEAHAGMTDKQEGVTGNIVTMQEFLLNELILFGSQRAG